MKNYFLLSWQDTKGAISSAVAPKGSKSDHELIQDLSDTTEMPFEMDLIKLSDGNEGIIMNTDLGGLKEIWLDYQPNNLAWPLMSKRLKDIIEGHLTGKENVNWLTVRVNGNGEQRVYFIPRFEKILDVLDVQKTLFVHGTDRIIRPCFSLFKIAEFSIFHQPSAYNLWKITSGIYVSEALKKAIQKEKLTGIVFEKTSVA